MTEPVKWVVGVISRIMTASGSAVAGGAFVWTAWEGRPGLDATRIVMHALTGFVLFLMAVHVAVRGFSDGFSQPPPAHEPQP